MSNWMISPPDSKPKTDRWVIWDEGGDTTIECDDAMALANILILTMEAAIVQNRKNDRLQAIADAAESFRAVPPEGLADNVPFQQYTTVADCRALVKAFSDAENTP